MTTNPTAARPFAEPIERMFAHHGLVAIVGDVHAAGYTALFAGRTEAYQAGRLVLGAFEADPEAGVPTITVNGAELLVAVER
jgi:hypothetical protein